MHLICLLFSVMYHATKEQPPRRREKFLVHSMFITSEDTKNPQSIARTVGFIIQTYLKPLQWNVRNDAGDEPTIYSQKISVTYLPQLEEGGSTGPQVRFGHLVLL